MAKFRLLAVTTSYPLRDDAAAGVFVRRLYQNLPEEWQITVVCPDDAVGVGCQRAVSPRIVPVRYAPKRWQLLSQNPGGIFASLRESRLRWLLLPLLIGAMLVQVIRLARASDLLHANWSICGAMAALAGRLVGRPVVTTFRGDDVANAERSGSMRALIWLCMLGSDAVTCVSEPMAERLKRSYPFHAGKIFVCLNGVDEAFLAVDRVPQPSEQLRLVTVGSLVHRKGYDTLLEAVAQMRYRDRVTLRIAGSGPERERLMAQASALGLDKQVTFIGELPPEQIPQFLTEGDVFVLSSRSEGRPNVVIEALAAGLPVISTMLPGVSGLVMEGVNGWLVPVGDAVAMSCALQLAHDGQELRHSMGARAREFMRASHHNWDVTGRHYDELFRACLIRRNAT